MAATVTISTVDILSVATSVTIEFIPQSFPAASGANIVLDNRYQVTTASDGTASLTLEEGVYDVRFLNLSGRGELTVQVPSSGTVTLASIITSTSPGFFSQVPRITTTQRDALNAQNGMIIYNTTTSTFQKYEDGQWLALGGGVGGVGDVTGPASATADAIVLFSGTTGKAIKDSTYTITSYAGTALLPAASASAARTNLGLGSAATSSTSDFEAAGAVSTHAAVTSGVHGISTFGATVVAGTSASAARSILEIGGASLGALTGTVAVDASNGITFAGTHAGNITTWSFSNVPTYYTCVLWNLVGTGGPYTVAFGGITVHETSNAIDTGTAAGDYYGILFSTIDGGTNWFVTQAGGESLT